MGCWIYVGVTDYKDIFQDRLSTLVIGFYMLVMSRYVYHDMEYNERNVITILLHWFRARCHKKLANVDIKIIYE